MKKIISIGVFVFLCFCVFVLPFNNKIQAQEELVEKTLQAVAGEDKNVVVGRQVLFSGVASTIPEGQEDNVYYLWNFGDGYTSQGVEVTHVYQYAGAYRVTLTLKLAEKTVQDEIIVMVDKDLAVLISDQTLTDEQVLDLQKKASKQGVLLVNIREVEESQDYIVTKKLAQKILEQKEDLRQANLVLLWTDLNVGLNAFLESSQVLANKENSTSLDNFGFGNKVIVSVVEENLSATARVAQSLFDTLKPQFILLTEKNSIIENYFNIVNISELTNALRDSEVNYQLIGIHTQRGLDKLKVWNFFSYLVNYMVNQGVPLNTIYLILVLPLIATVIAFARQVIGIKALGIYAPSIFALSFLVMGLKYGVAIFLMVLLMGTVGRLLAKKIRLLYLPRMALVLIIVALSIFALFFLGALFGKSSLMVLSVFPILIMVLLAEKFVSVQIERGNKVAIILILETLLLSVACYWLANWQSLRILILGYPEIIFLTVIINIFLGKWSGLRLTEYIRFRKVIKHVELSEKK